MKKEEFVIFSVEENEIPHHGAIVVPCGFLCTAVYYDGRGDTVKGFFSVDGNNQKLNVYYWFYNLTNNHFA